MNNPLEKLHSLRIVIYVTNGPRLSESIISNDDVISYDPDYPDDATNAYKIAYRRAKSIRENGYTHYDLKAKWPHVDFYPPSSITKIVLCGVGIEN